MCLLRLGIVGACSVVKFGRPSKVSLHLICFCHSVYKRGSVLLFNNTGVGGTAWKQEKKELRSHEPVRSAQPTHEDDVACDTSCHRENTRVSHTLRHSPCPPRTPGSGPQRPYALRLYLVCISAESARTLMYRFIKIWCSASGVAPRGTVERTGATCVRTRAEYGAGRLTLYYTRCSTLHASVAPFR